MTADIASNIARIEKRIEAACARAGRQRREVLLIAVSKTFPAVAIDQAVAAGVTDIGENRVQEFREKEGVLHTRPVTHLIGHLQTNKAKEAARLFDVIHTVDSIDLAEKLARHAAALGRKLRILMQVNVGDEPQKSGVSLGDALPLARKINAIGELEFAGFMTIPPIAAEESTRGFFRSLRALAAETGSLLALPRVELSMGMSEDFELAIEEGATMIRLGRAIFGSRESA